MRVARLALFAFGVALSACADAPTASSAKSLPDPTPARALGLLEITFNDVGTPRMSASITPVGTPRQPGGPNAAVIPVPGGLQLGLRTTSTMDVGGERYLQAVFQVRNATADGTANSRVLHNVTFIPVETAANIYMTPIKVMRKQDGTAADPAIAMDFRPAGAVMDNGAGAVASQYPDVVQAYTEAEVAAVDMSAYPAVTNRFPYGFVTRRMGDNTTRDLPANPAPGQFDGSVTFAFHFPKQAASANNPFTVSIQVVAVEDEMVRVTQSVEEQGAGQAAFEARAASLNAAVVSVFDGGRYGGTATSRAFCSLRSGGMSGSPMAVLQSSPTIPAVGTAMRFTGAEGQSLCVDGGATGAEFTLIPVNTATAGSTSLSVLASGISAVVGPPTPTLLPSLLGSATSTAIEENTDFHLRLREWERSALGSRMHTAAARSAVRTSNVRSSILPGVPTVGSLLGFNVASGCSGTPSIRTGRVASVGAHVIVVTDTANPAGGFTTAQYDSIALEFDSIAYPVNVDNFGAPMDLDGNGRVIAFYTRAVNELSPPASSSIVAGYFTARDLFDASAAGCTLSNQGEMFYMLVPDPTGAVNSNSRSVPYVRGGTVGTMAHEFQHLINASRRMYVNNASGFEEVWLNEGLSHVAEELAFYRTAPGLTPRSNIVLSTLTTGPNASRRVAAFNTYANQNFGRFRSWLQRPDTSGAFKTNDALAARGAIWAFLRYAADRKGGSEPAFWNSLVNSQVSGRANLQAVLGAEPTVWLRDFTTAIYSDDAVTGAAPEHTISSWNLRSVYGGLNGSYPLAPRALTSGTPLTLSYSPGGGSTYLRFAVGASATANLSLTSGSAAAPSNISFMLVRTR